MEEGATTAVRCRTARSSMEIGEFEREGGRPRENERAMEGQALRLGFPKQRTNVASMRERGQPRGDFLQRAVGHKDGNGDP
jgi:hypothetical protein